MGLDDQCEQGLYFIRALDGLFTWFMIAVTALCFNILGDTLRDKYGLRIKG
jgi:ABC-type dipeptide/oligopeptide/nickel transport system permease subunit